MKLSNKHDPIGWLWRYDKDSEWLVSGNNIAANLPDSGECFAFYYLDIADGRVKIKIDAAP
ncbi:hypothetical protein [Undibacterium sp.]|uniref:hypothetical protein n=1 Tax=Undibacterium sp. TaxID=1914977 RepID=UPI0037516C04